MSPLFPNLKDDRQALKLNGKDDNLRRSDFRALATTAGLRVGYADAAIDDLLPRMTAAIGKVAVPKAIRLEPEAQETVEEMLKLCRDRVAPIDHG